jgi:serine/threonine protein kinase HipA of HipAB toxin-antitoxin module
MSRDQLKRLKELETENTRLRRTVSDLTLDKMILTVSAEDKGDQETILWMVFIPDAPAHLSPSCRPAALLSRISNALLRQRASDCEALEQLGVSHDYRNVKQQRSAFEP